MAAGNKENTGIFGVARTKRMKYFLLILILLPACSLKQWCYDRYPPQEKVIVERDTIMKDTTIYIHVPGDVQIDTVEVTIPVAPDIDVSQYEIRGETQFARARAWLELKDAELMMYLKLEQKEQMIEKVIEDAVQERSTHTTKVITVIREVKHTPLIYRIALWFSVVVLILIIGYLGLKLSGTKRLLDDFIGGLRG